jgi:hypothetical protein
MESAQGAGWNHGNAVYGIKPQELYSIRASRNAMRDFVGVPYNARGALIPYQACGLDNKKGTFGRQKFLFCWFGRRDLKPCGLLRRGLKAATPRWQYPYRINFLCNDYRELIFSQLHSYELY